MSRKDADANPTDSHNTGAESTGTLTRLVRCPACGKSTEFSPRNPARPFCSQRCRDYDLGNWATERYNLATPLDAAVADVLRSIGESMEPDELQALIESPDQSESTDAKNSNRSPRE
jgi:hypothetical protein